jgi:hypothetical protein
LTTTDPAVRELDRARRMGWARAYALQAEVAELESVVAELESDYESTAQDHGALVDDVDFYVFAMRVAGHLLASGYAAEARHFLWQLDQYAYRKKEKCPSDPLLAACRIVEKFDERAARDHRDQWDQRKRAVGGAS